MSRTSEENALQASMIGTESSSTQDTSPSPTPLESRLVVPPPPELSAPSESSEQQTNSISEPSADEDHGQIVPGESSSEEPPAFEELVHQPTPEVEPLHIVEIEVEEHEGPQTIHPEAVILEEEFVHTEELVKTAKLSTHPTYTPSNYTSLKKRREAMNPVGQATTPLQPSPANRLDRKSTRLLQSH